MRKTKWTLIWLVSLALLGAPQAFAAGKGQGEGKGNQAVGTPTQGQWETNQPPGWDNQGKKKGWTKKDSNSSIPGGLNKNQQEKGKYPKGLEKNR